MKREDAFREIETKLNANNGKLREELKKNGKLQVEYKNITEYFQVISDKKEPGALLENSCDAGLRAIMKWLENK